MPKIGSGVFTRFAPVIPETLRRSAERCREFVAKGEIRTPQGWLPFTAMIWAQSAQQAAKAQNSLTDCRRVTIKAVADLGKG